MIDMSLFKGIEVDPQTRTARVQGGVLGMELGRATLPHGQGRDAVEFYTEKKVSVERWPSEWSRKF